MFYRWGARRLAAVGAVSACSALAVAGLGVSPSAAGPQGGEPVYHRVVVKGLDNPRQMHLLNNGRVIVAEAGHGSYQEDNCQGEGQNAFCIGLTGKIGRLSNGVYTHRMKGLISAAGGDGTFATGADGVAVRKPGKLMPVMTYAPPQFLPDDLQGKQQLGKLLINRPAGERSQLANISRFEIRNDPDGEGVDSNPYAGLGLPNKTLVADAAGDYIAAVRPGGDVRLWATMPEYGRRVDAVPTSLTKTPDGTILVGELHSEQQGEAKVLEFDRGGDRIGATRGFTTVTGVARTADGTLYVSELFGGCSFGEPGCFPGQVVRVAPDGTRTRFPVPFPSGVVARGDRVLVAAFSTSAARGGFGPGTSGRIWRLQDGGFQ